MNKKITSSALAALMIAGSTSFSALAAMANGTVVIGTKAFDMAYANDPKNADEIGNAIVASGAVYVKDFEGNWIDNNTTKKVEASVIPAVTYKDAAGKETKFDAKDMNASATTLTVEKVSAINLKEVEVKFSTAVDATTAENDENYTLSTGTVKSATVLEDGMTVRLELTSGISNQVKNKISIKNVKAGTMTIAAVKDMEFTPIDNELPKVVSVTPLGNKAIKVVFSEPIQTVTIGSFKLDGKSFYGSSTVASRTIVLKPYDTSSLTTGEHTLTIAGVVDYSGLKSLSEDAKFTVVTDDVKPVISNLTATLETVTVTFSEDVDSDTVLAENIYWMSGTTKMKAVSMSKLAGNKYEFDFTGKALPGYETALYVEAVKDYSGNQISETTVKVKATIDETRPTVTDVKVDDTKTVITVKFDKMIQAASADSKYFVITDKDSKVKSVKSITLDPATSKVLTITLYSALAQGENTIKISGIQDATTLKNSMLDYTTTIAYTDTKAPEFSYATTNALTRMVIMNFNEKMDAATLANPANYIVNFNGVARQLPVGTDISVVQDSKAVLLTFPEKINDTVVTFGGAGLTNVTVMGVKDIAGNVLKNFTQNVAVSSTDLAGLASYSADYATSITAAITGEKVIKVKFNRGIAKAVKTDFLVTGDDVDGNPLVIDTVSVNNSDVVTITFTKNIDQNDGTLDIKTIASNNMETIVGSKVTDLLDIPVANMADETSPVVKLATNVTKLVATNTGGTATIKLPFNEKLDATAGIQALMGDDLIVKRISDGKILKNSLDYTTALSVGNDKEITITIVPAVGGNSEYSVAIKADAKYIRDASTENYVNETSAIYADAFIDLAAPTSSVKYNDVNANHLYDAGDTIVVTFNEAVASLAVGDITPAVGTAGNTPALDNSTFVASAANTVYTLTLANGGPALDLVAGNTLTIVKAKIVDAKGNVAPSNLVITLPTLP